MIASLNIGSNIGDSPALIRQAVAAVSALSELAPGRQSPVITTQPWGFTSLHPFLNIGVEIQTSLDPLALLDRLQQLEQSIPGSGLDNRHRNPDGTYRDRPLDIDIIHCGSLVFSSPRLTIPHPRLHLRPFVLQPLIFLSPTWTHPLLHLTPAQLLTTL